MPEVLYSTPEELAAHLPEGHPALKKDGKLKKRALAVWNRRVLPSRYGQNILDEDNFPIRNTDLFEAIADEIKFFPDSYDQEQWGEDVEKPTLCGTAFCVAGHAGHLTGWHPTEDPYDEDTLNFEELWSRGAKVDAPSVGSIELGLTNIEANILFVGNWQPIEELSVHKALRKLGKGAKLSDVTDMRIVEATHYQMALRLYQEEEDRTIHYTGETE